MISRGRAIGAALALCALSICAFAAASASASELTAVTCKSVTAGTGHYNNAHCVTPEVEKSNFDTVVLPLSDPATEVTAVNTELEPALRATIGGSSITVKCTNSETTGATVDNQEPTAGKHTIATTATKNTYTGCKAVLKANEARWCGIEEIPTGEPGAPGVTGMVSTKALKGSTTGVNHQVIIEPASGTVFAKFGIESKTEGGVECPFSSTITVEVTGKVECEADTTNHAHITCTEANNGTALKANGGTAKYLDTLGAVMTGTENTVGAQTFT